MDFAFTSDQQNIRDAILKYRARIYELARSLTVPGAATAGVAEAQEIVAVFAASPGAGTIGWNCGMLDRPHLSRAQGLLAQVEGA